MHYGNVAATPNFYTISARFLFNFLFGLYVYQKIPITIGLPSLPFVNISIDWKKNYCLYPTLF